MVIRVIISCCLILTFLHLRPQEATFPFQNPVLPTGQRIDDLISRLTLEEKVSQPLYNSPSIDRLDIPEYNWWNECLHGVARAGKATVFPQAIGLAATFDDKLVYRIADAISTEARAKFNEAIKKENRTQYLGLSFWTPNINIFRDPRWGRGQETYGEDPFLTGRMGAAFVKGLQGNDPKYLKAAACAKHFAVHSGPEKTRHAFNAIPDEIDFRETYLPAFKTLSDANVEAVMCAYNRLYDEPCCGSNYLLNQILRNEWGFKGHIVTDCWALDDIWLRHKVVETREEAAAMAAKAGVNLNCGYIYQHLPEAIEKGLIAESSLDSILYPLLKTRFRLGLFDPPELIPWSGIGEESVNSPEHKALAYEAAVKSIVLLQNKSDILPLNRDSISNIFVTGPTAADILALTGNYNGWAGDMVTFLEGITRSVDAGTIVDYAMGCQMVTTGGYNGFWQAQMSDVIIVCLGNTRMLEGEDGDAMLNSKGGDRSDLRLPESQREFIKLLRDKVPGKPIIAIITGGSAIALQDVLEFADAVLFVWYPGEQGGMAAADVIFGKENPSGRLPVTFYKSVDDLPDFDDYAMEGRTYKFFDGEPLFPFGYGLSYTTFEYMRMATNPEGAVQGTKVKAELTVQNVGQHPGEEVVLIYASKERGPIEKKGMYLPWKEKTLVGFSRVYLEVGETKTIPIEVDLMNMHQWDQVNKRYFVEKGVYFLMVSPIDSGGFMMKVEIE